jgi:hypothetical protein
VKKAYPAHLYYTKARTFYTQLMTDADVMVDRNKLMTIVNDISARIIHLTVQSVARTFFFLWAV